MPEITLAELGIRGLESWETGQRPKEPRHGMLTLYPTGMWPLTGMTSMVKSYKPKDVEVSHWEKNLPTQGVTVTGVYTDVLSTAYTAGVNAIGTALWIKMAEADAKNFRNDHVVLLREAGDSRQDLACEVISVTLNGAGSYVAARTLHATTATDAAGYNPTSADRLLVIGTATVSGGVTPDQVNYNPHKITNFLQTFRTSYSITGDMNETYLYTGDALAEEKREKFELHGIQMEKAYIYGEKHYVADGGNGHPKYWCQGMIPFIKENASANVFDFRHETVSAFAGKTWAMGGWDWMRLKLEEIFRYGGDTKIALVGTGAMNGLDHLAQLYGNIQLVPAGTTFGYQLREWISPFGRLLLKTHPLFSHEVTDQHRMLCFELKYMKRPALRPTHTRVVSAMNEGEEDLMKEEWLTQECLEFDHPDCYSSWDGVGEDNVE